MQYLRPSRAWYVCALVTALLSATVLSAAAAPAYRGNEFSGYFDFNGVQEQGDLVQVTLHLQLFNHTDSDVKSVIVTLVDPTPAMTLRGNFQPVKTWKSQQFITMSQQFTVTKSEFSDWTKGRPNLIILFQDSKGKSWQKTAQLNRRPLLPVEQK